MNNAWQNTNDHVHKHARPIKIVTDHESRVYSTLPCIPTRCSRDLKTLIPESGHPWRGSGRRGGLLAHSGALLPGARLHCSLSLLYHLCVKALSSSLCSSTILCPSRASGATWEFLANLFPPGDSQRAEIETNDVYFMTLKVSENVPPPTPVVHEWNWPGLLTACADSIPRTESGDKMFYKLRFYKFEITVYSVKVTQQIPFSAARQRGRGRGRRQQQQQQHNNNNNNNNDDDNKSSSNIEQ